MGAGRNWVRLAPNGTNMGLFKTSFRTFWLVLKLILKSPRFVPFGMANSDGKFDSPGREMVRGQCRLGIWVKDFFVPPDI